MWLINYPPVPEICQILKREEWVFLGQILVKVEPDNAAFMRNIF